MRLYVPATVAGMGGMGAVDHDDKSQAEVNPQNIQVRESQEGHQRQYVASRYKRTPIFMP